MSALPWRCTHARQAVAEGFDEGTDGSEAMLPCAVPDCPAGLRFVIEKVHFGFRYGADGERVTALRFERHFRERLAAKAVWVREGERRST